MKREVIFILIVVLSLVSLSLIYASEESQVEDAYACLATRINQTGCSALSLEEKAFSSLADGECMNQLSADNSSNRCWPKSGCTVKSTSQAVLALNSRIDTTAAENWILSQTATPQNLEWFLEIEILDTGSASCDITYSGSTYKISIRQDKTIDKSAGGLLTLASDYGNYWLRININLYNKPIDIQCDKEFITTLLFKQKYPPSSTIHVSEYIQHAQGQGKVTETVDSLCFAQSGNCNYEASLWAALVLASVHQDISDFMPYLITMKDDLANKIYIPESFLYYLTGKFREELLVKQKAGGYWSESGSRYYDTALALLPFSYESPTEKENSKTWLLGNQQKTGCWNNGNIRDTAFLLYSIWPKENSLPGICEDDSECPEVSCAYVSCEDRNCVYTDYGCDNNDGCCPDGCDSSNDNDCEVIECRDDSKCPATEYSEVYCLDQGSVYQDVYTWSCDTSINECVQEADEQSVKTCENNDCVDGYCGENVCSIFKPCPDGYDCKDNVCVETQVVECSWLKFCQDGYKCDNNVCVPDIIFTSDSDCGTTEESELYCYDEMNVYQTVYSYLCDTSTISGTCE
ncbi:MAG: hypothetical protein NTZ83_01715, partial [Candidatus Pacearchaeota archaeon]|nr:hypothetical protein [Candidatus Pacearchaeota archaeon]